MRSVCIHSSERLNLDAFLHELDVPVRFEFEGYDEERSYYYFSRPGISTTLFVIAEGPDEYEVMIDGLASYSDYKFFPYLPIAYVSISIMNHWLFPNRQVEQLIVYTMSPGLKTPSGKKSLC